MADNTLQWDWIATIKTNLELLFTGREDVFVGGDLLWYPVEGNPRIRYAPDAMVVFGRPKGYRGSYKQWEEGHLAPQVVFEILSPQNTAEEMDNKRAFYESRGVEEYYEFDPEIPLLRGWILKEGNYAEIARIARGWTSPRLGVHFQITRGELILTRPDGERFLTLTEMHASREVIRQQAEAARIQALEAEQQRDRERLRAETAEQQAAAAARQIEQLSQELARLRVPNRTDLPDSNSSS